LRGAFLIWPAMKEMQKQLGLALMDYV